jgi:hypothetical protein
VIRQIKTLGLGVLAVFAVGAVMSASASAHAFVVCREGGTTKYQNNLCAKKVETGKFSFLPVEGAEKYKVEDTSSTIKLEGEFFGGELKTIMECKLVFSGEIVAGGIGKGEDTLSECKLYELTKERKENLLTGVDCTIPNTLFNVEDKVVTGQGSGPEEEINSTGGEKTFAQIDVSGGSCPLRGDYELKESEVEILPSKQIAAGMVCSLPEAGVGKVEHEIVCSGTGSHLRMSGVAASFVTTETVKLSDGASWAVE